MHMQLAGMRACMTGTGMQSARLSTPAWRSTESAPPWLACCCLQTPGLAIKDYWVSMRVGLGEPNQQGYQSGVRVLVVCTCMQWLPIWGRSRGSAASRSLPASTGNCSSSSWLGGSSMV